MLRKSPWFTAASVVVLGLGIGATTAIFSLVDAALLRPLPFRDAHQLVMLWERSAQTGKSGASMPNFADWRDRNSTFSGMAASTGIVQFPLMDDGGGLPEAIALDGVTTEFFDVLGVPPLLGRTFNVEDDRSRTPAGVVLSEQLWRTRFHADPAVVGRAVRIGSPPRPIPVIGVVPSSARILGATDMWEHVGVERDESIRGARGIRVVGRLKSGVTSGQAQADLEVIAASIERRSPATNKGWTVAIEPIQEAIVGDDLRNTSLVLGGVVLFVLLLACANIANLILARGVGRAREMAVRAALGATRRRIVSQLLVESTMLGTAGGVVGLAIAWGLLRIAPSLLPAGAVPESIVLAVDWRVAIFALAVSLVTALLFGLAPAWHAAHVPMVEAMQSGGRGASDGAGRLRQSLAVVEIAAALLLVTGAGLLLRTLMSLDRVDSGYQADNVITMSIRVPFWKMRKAGPGELASYWQSIEEEVGRVPGVRVAALGSDVPLDGIGFTRTFAVAGVAAPDPANLPSAHYQLVSPRFFDALGIPLLRGRTFTERDATAAPPVCIVNEEVVRRHFAGREPLGARIMVETLTLPPQTVTREIVGVVRQVKTRPDESPDNALQLYVPLAQNAWMATTVVVRTVADPALTLTAIKSAIARVDGTQAVSRVRTMRVVEAEATARPRLRAQLVAAFAFLATVLAAVGIFSVLMFMVQQRKREFGIRLAVGATAQDVLRLVIGDGIRLTAFGLILGLGASAFFARFLGALLFGVAPLDSVTFVAAPTVLGVVALVASVVPAIRAMRADPAVTLRSE
jgi:putative ABC transport system permease protein